MQSILPEDTRPSDWKLYYKNVLRDFREMQENYPWSYLTILPTVKPEIATIRVVAVNKELIETVCGAEEDFLGKYSRELYLCIPISYMKTGCKVYGAKWVDVEKLENKDIHFSREKGKLIKTQYGLNLCVGTPESFPLMENVILENVKTAENMLIAYEKVMAGKSDHLELIAYAHGDAGKEQFLRNRKKYIPEG